MHKSGFVRVKPKLNEGSGKEDSRLPFWIRGKFVPATVSPLCFLSCQQPLLRILWETQDLSEKVKIFTRKNIRQKAVPFREGEKEKFYGETQELLAEKKDPLLRGGGRVKYPLIQSVFTGNNRLVDGQRKEQRDPRLYCCVVASSYSPPRFSPKKGINGMNHSPFSFFTLFKPLLQF